MIADGWETRFWFTQKMEIGVVRDQGYNATCRCHEVRQGWQPGKESR